MKIASKNTGFTLIELMIVVAVIAVLASIGYPMYQDYVKKTRRSDAKVSLMKLQQDQEKFRMNCPQYASGFVFPLPTPPVPTCDRTNNIYRLVSNAATAINSAPSADNYYTLSITIPTTANCPKVPATSTTPGSACYTLTATAANQQIKDTDCATLSIDQDGKKTSTGNTSVDCWK